VVSCWRGRSEIVHLVGVGPIEDGSTEVGYGVAECAELQVEDGDDPVVGAEHGVVEAVVSVDEARCLLFGDRL